MIIITIYSAGMLSQQASSSGACDASQLPADMLVQSVIASGAPEACRFLLRCNSWPGRHTGRFNGMELCKELNLCMLHLAR